MDELAIDVRSVSKAYNIWASPAARLNGPLLARLGQLPFLPVGLAERLSARSHRSLRRFYALHDISLRVRRNETVGIVGRNGSGKSTLLQIIAGTVTPSAGTVAVRGRIAALLELGSGFNPEFTGRENVYLNGAILGLSKGEVDRKFDDIAAFADIGSFLDQPLKTYSSGMQMRLAFAVIANIDADVLLIDEALAVGDAYFVQKCMRFLRRFQERGTILFVSHDTGAVISLCTRAILLDQGVARIDGSPKTIAETYLAALMESLQGPSAVPADPAAAVEAPKDGSVPAPSSGAPDDWMFPADGAPFSRSFGKGGATIRSVRLHDSRGAAVHNVEGGEPVCLTIQAVASQDLFSPIIGFYVKDRLGQNLFGENTYGASVSVAPTLRPGTTVEARFSFSMPRLPMGDYSVCAAIAEGTQQLHVQHHWVHDALFFKSLCTSASSGLVGIPVTTELVMP
jgi:homopolymeric O-antigen transport system ATP-binding protein